MSSLARADLDRAVHTAAWAISRAARRLSLRTACLHRLWRRTVMLSRCGIATSFDFGISLRGAALKEHAWVDAGGTIIIGEEQSLGLARVATLPVAGDAKAGPARSLLTGVRRWTSITIGLLMAGLTYADATRYLPDDILAKVDRAAMSVSLETRVPFLDHRVAEVAARIDPSLKIHGGKGKQILRKLLDRYVPSELVDRPKAGFAVPVGEWIKNPLRDWAENLLDPKRLSEDGYFDASAVRSRWVRSRIPGLNSVTAARRDSLIP